MSEWAFTGTREGMTPIQRAEVVALLYDHRGCIRAMHHGGCVGSDEQLHGIFRRLSQVKIVVHPCDIFKMRAQGLDMPYELRSADSPLSRNHTMVDESATLIATPQETEEQLRSGTWATVRYARKKGRRIFCILPNGERM